MAASTPTFNPEAVVEAASQLSSEVLHSLFVSASARELRERQEELEPKPPPPDLATMLAYDLRLTVARLVELWDSFGVDRDISGAFLLKQLTALGVAEGEALDVIHRCSGWRPRSDDERERDVARAMLADGFTRAQIAHALAATRGTAA